MPWGAYRLQALEEDLGALEEYQLRCYGRVLPVAISSRSRALLRRTMDVEGYFGQGRLRLCYRQY